MGRRLVVCVAAVLAVAAASAGWAWASRRPAPVAADLRRFHQIDLGGLAGADSQVGVTRSNYLPMLITRSGRGRTSLAVVDAHTARVIDAGPVPVDGWVTNAYPRASDRFVAVVTDVCPVRPQEGDAGLECVVAFPSQPIAEQLAVYDIRAGTWATLALDAPSSQLESLADVDGTTATLRRYHSTPGRPDTWATVDLTKPLRVGPFTNRSGIRPNGLAMRNGHIDGWGWKASDLEGGQPAATWTGTVAGRPRKIGIATFGLRHFYGAGRCLVIGSFRSHHLDHLHRLCAS